MLSRVLNVMLLALLIVLGGLLVARRMGGPAGGLPAGPPEPPGFEELNRDALERLEAGAPDALAAFERARAAIVDPGAGELYARGIEELREGRRDLAEAAFACAARAERERWTEP